MILGLDVGSTTCKYVLCSDDGETVTIPNSKIWGNPIRNMSRKTKKGVE